MEMKESKEVYASIVQWLAMEDMRLENMYNSALGAVLRRGSDYHDTIALHQARMRLDDFRVFQRSLLQLLGLS